MLSPRGRVSSDDTTIYQMGGAKETDEKMLHEIGFFSS